MKAATHEIDTTLFEYLLRLADSSLILGQRLSEEIGHGPVLEEEMAQVNIALDLIGQARLLFAYAGDIEGRGRGEDDLAFKRDSGDFRNLLLVEQPNLDFAFIIARQFFFDVYQALLYENLSASADPRLAEIAAKAVKESRYHLRHSRDWVIRLGDGTEESHERMQRAVDELWRFTGEAFMADDLEQQLVEQGIAADPGTLRPEWQRQVDMVLREATLEKPTQSWMDSGGKQGRHTEYLGHILSDLQFLQRAYPNSEW